MEFKDFVQYAGLTIYNIIMAYFLGLMIFWTLPVPHLSWQFSLLPGYVIGAVISSSLTFLIIKKWHVEKTIKIIVATIVLVVTVAVSYSVVTERSDAFTARAHQYMQDNYEK
ncbi:MAG TPA: hypothetical protein VFO38_04610 [Candidatus Saccharimonadales bacterium]|nr:hypothetical protein [Candidatus Saccharimonadales bacterium]